MFWKNFSGEAPAAALAAAVAAPAAVPVTPGQIFPLDVLVPNL